MITIWKHPLIITDEQVVRFPPGATLLHVGLDPQRTPCIWAKVTPETSSRPYRVYLVGTGNPMPDDVGEHLGSFVQGPFVWHAFAGS